MSQKRVQKAPSAGVETGNKARPSVAKTSVDNIPCNRPKEPKDQNNLRMKTEGRSKSKIPKSIRYDLENALVGLCDVWFEDIKPHLVRNNIKLHVDGSSGEPANGYQAQLPSGALGCSHLDPGAASDHRRQSNASYAGFCSTQPTALKARCRKPARPPLPGPLPQLLASPQIIPLTPDMKSLNKHTKQNTKRSRRKPRLPPPSLESNWKVPRLCRTHTILSPVAFPRNVMRRAQTAVPAATKASRYEDYFQLLLPFRREKTRDKWTQTEHWNPPQQRVSAINRPTNLHRPLRSEVNHVTAFHRALCRPVIPPNRPMAPCNRPIVSLNKTEVPPKILVDTPNRHLDTLMRSGVPHSRPTHPKMLAFQQKRHAPQERKDVFSENKLPVKMTSLKRFEASKSSPGAPENGTLDLRTKSRLRASENETLDLRTESSPGASENSTLDLKTKSRFRVPENETLDLRTTGNPGAPEKRALDLRTKGNPGAPKNRTLDLRSNKLAGSKNKPSDHYNKTTSAENKPIYRQNSPRNAEIMLEDLQVKSAVAENGPLPPKKSMQLPIPPNLQKQPLDLRTGLSFKRNKPSSCERCPATTAFHPARDQKKDKTRKSREVKRNTEAPTLFDSDLIDIIGEKQDKKVRVLYRSPTRAESASSIMNLFPSPRDRQEDCSVVKKTRHWK